MNGDKETMSYKVINKKFDFEEKNQKDNSYTIEIPQGSLMLDINIKRHSFPHTIISLNVDMMIFVGAPQEYRKIILIKQDQLMPIDLKYTFLKCLNPRVENIDKVYAFEARNKPKRKT